MNTSRYSTVDREAELVGENIQTARTQIGMSQTALAHHMHAQGFTAWRQTTVSRTELGTRALNVDEAAELEDLLGGDIWFGTRMDRAARKVAHVGREHKERLALKQISRAESALQEALDAVQELKSIHDRESRDDG